MKKKVGFFYKNFEKPHFVHIQRIPLTSSVSSHFEVTCEIKWKSQLAWVTPGQHDSKYIAEQKLFQGHSSFMLLSHSLASWFSTSSYQKREDIKLKKSRCCLWPMPQRRNYWRRRIRSTKVIRRQNCIRSKLLKSCSLGCSTEVKRTASHTAIEPLNCVPKSEPSMGSSPPW